MTGDETPRQESPDAQRKRIEAMMQDPEMQQVAATARPRGPERSPHPEHANKQRMQSRLATMAEAAERDLEIEQRIRDREKAARAHQETKADGQQVSPISAQWDDRQHVNLPAPLAQTYHLAPARKLHDGQTALPFDYDLLASPPEHEARFEVGYLPTLEPEPSMLVPHALLDLWDSGASRGRHGPVPLARRIGLEVLLAVPPDARANEAVLLSTTMGELAGGVWPSTKYVPKRHGPMLVRDLHVVHDGRVAWSDGKHGSLRVLAAVRDWPRSFHRDARLAFDVRLPPGSRQGPQIDRNAVRMTWFSYRHNRLLLTAYCLFDRYGTVHGRMVAPTLPAVLRNEAGYLLDARGKVIAERGAPTRRATHKRAVQTGERVPNPEALTRYRALIGRDLILAGFSRVKEAHADVRDQRRRVIDAAKDLAKPVAKPPKRGATDQRRPALIRAEVIGPDGPNRGLRIMPTDDYLVAHAARWAARKHGE